MFATVTRRFTFSAAHQLPKFGPSHPCARLHGHTWSVSITVAGAVNPETGVVLDYGEITKAWKPLHEVLDHNYLNAIDGLETPSSEMVAAWIWRKLIGPLTDPNKLYQMTRIVIQEGEGGSCEFFGAL